MALKERLRELELELDTGQSDVQRWWRLVKRKRSSWAVPGLGGKGGVACWGWFCHRWCPRGPACQIAFLPTLEIPKKFCCTEPLRSFTHLSVTTVLQHHQCNSGQLVQRTPLFQKQTESTNTQTMKTNLHDKLIHYECWPGPNPKRSIVLYLDKPKIC